MVEVKRVLNSKAYDEQLQRNAALCWTQDQIKQADQQQILTMQYRLGLGDQWGLMEFPRIFLPPGHSQFNSRRIVRTDQFLPPNFERDEVEVNRAWLEIVRFTIARLTFPGYKSSIIASYSTCLSDLNILKALVKKVLGAPIRDCNFWNRLEVDVSKVTENQKKLVFLVDHYHRMGVLPDAFSTTKLVEADEPERNRSGEAEHENTINENRKWQPLPMEFVAQAGWRSLKIVKSIAPTLLAALDEALEVAEVTHNIKSEQLSKKSARRETLKARNRVIEGWKWEDENGESLLELGFTYDLRARKHGTQIPWPPRTFSQAMDLAHNLVLPAHLWMVLLGNGPRNSEAVSMHIDCLIPSPKGNFRWKGRTYKMSGIVGGREFNAEVPDIITQSILQQVKLAAITRKHRKCVGDALWVGNHGKDIKVLSRSLNHYVDVLCLRELLGDDNPSCHEHRFRKTLAKIVALALTNSIMVLQDCFGHTDSVMTLMSYIAADPTIAQEVIKVQKELTIMMAVDAIMDRDNVGGPGASALQQRADDFLKRIGKSKFEPQDAYEFARRETFDGRSWMMVAPGILCTAPHDVTQVSTPCALGQRRHNPANCKTGCDWQLLLKAYYATQADDTVDYALKNLQRAVDEDDSAMQAFWAGQAKTWLYRYEQVAEKWQDHPLVKKYVPRPILIRKKTAEEVVSAATLGASA